MSLVELTNAKLNNFSEYFQNLVEKAHATGVM